MTSSVAKGM